MKVEMQIDDMYFDDVSLVLNISGHNLTVEDLIPLMSETTYSQYQNILAQGLKGEIHICI